MFGAYNCNALHIKTEILIKKSSKIQRCMNPRTLGKKICTGPWLIKLFSQLLDYNSDLIFCLSIITVHRTRETVISK